MMLSAPGGHTPPGGLLRGRRTGQGRHGRPETTLGRGLGRLVRPSPCCAVLSTMTPDDDPAEVRAAGGVVVHEDRLAVVHRPRYDDWSLPKGKLDAGESWEDAALREVAEETGLRCRLLDELPAVPYTDRRGRPKRV